MIIVMIIIIIIMIMMMIIIIILIMIMIMMMMKMMMMMTMTMTMTMMIRMIIIIISERYFSKRNSNVLEPLTGCKVWHTIFKVTFARQGIYLKMAYKISKKTFDISRMKRYTSGVIQLM